MCVSAQFNREDGSSSGFGSWKTVLAVPVPRSVWFLGHPGFTLNLKHSVFGNGPNTVSESTVSNTELSEFFGAH